MNIYKSRDHLVLCFLMKFSWVFFVRVCFGEFHISVCFVQNFLQSHDKQKLKGSNLSMSKDITTLSDMNKRIQHLANEVLGPETDYNQLDIIQDKDGIERSAMLCELKLIVKNNCDIHVDISNDVDCKFRNGIVKFLAVNAKHNDPFNALIAVGRHSRPQKQVLQKYQISNDSNIQLIGEYGVKSKERIPAFVVLGKYRGFECTQSEFEQLYNNTRYHYMARHYALTLDFDLNNNEDREIESEMYTNNPEIDCKNEHMSDDTPMTTPNSIIDDKGRILVDNIIVDGFKCKNDDNLMLWINDARSKLTHENVNNLKQNVTIIQAKIDGWPTGFICTCKDIKVNDAILLDYGEYYAKIDEQEQLYNRQVVKRLHQAIQMRV